MIRPAQSSASSFPVSYLIYLLPEKLQYCNIIIYRILFILFLAYIIFYFWVVTWGKKWKKRKNENKKKHCPQKNCPFSSRKLIRGYAPRKNASHKTPGKINALEYIQIWKILFILLQFYLLLSLGFLRE